MESWRESCSVNESRATFWERGAGDGTSLDEKPARKKWFQKGGGSGVKSEEEWSALNYESTGATLGEGWTFARIIRRWWKFFVEKKRRDLVFLCGGRESLPRVIERKKLLVRFEKRIWCIWRSLIRFKRIKRILGIKVPRVCYSSRP